MIFRFLALLLVIFSAFLFPWWGVAALMAIYARYYRGYELPFVMFFVDGYYGAFGEIPVLMIAALIIVSIFAFLRQGGVYT
jgi:hypothetical protein